MNAVTSVPDIAPESLRKLAHRLRGQALDLPLGTTEERDLAQAAFLVETLAAGLASGNTTAELERAMKLRA